MRLKIKAVPGAAKSEVVGWYGDQLKVRVSQPPEKGKANKAVLSLLMATLDISANSIGIVSGHQSVSKVVEITNLSEEEVIDRLSSAISN